MYDNEFTPSHPVFAGECHSLYFNALDSWINCNNLFLWENMVRMAMPLRGFAGFPFPRTEQKMADNRKVSKGYKTGANRLVCRVSYTINCNAEYSLGQIRPF